MADITVPRSLPDCKLLQGLARKACSRTDINFNFLGQLDEFRERVSGEVRHINELFPEYTPHDEQYHLSRLFHVADTVLGLSLLESMNSAELFVLAVALYGHDWGMAVSRSEKDYILAGVLPEGARSSDLWVLEDERNHFAEFALRQRLPLDAKGCVPDIPIEMWREYVRETHAARSGERVKRFFDAIDGGVADAASRACLGHWLSFEELQDYDTYPPSFSVLREEVNLRAVTIYLRLVDLLDLGEDRTPYVIWKFVAPRDPESGMEWAKHRALRAVTCPSYQGGRVIKVDGSTSDHEVYAALEDLRHLCEQELRGCSDLLARMNDPRHRLDLHHVDWRVAPLGFRAVSIRFDFDRKRMFDMLSEEIYQGDHHVFLRELLQNSVDAIRMRREVLQLKGVDPDGVGKIKVAIEHGPGGDALVTWRDDGVGMDEYIVRNYLALAGRSYYQSRDFERLGLKMDPISRFGIGILTCFMVADRVDIETFQDPYLHNNSRVLRIAIPAIDRQFRIEVRPAGRALPGTTVRVFVKGAKLARRDAGHALGALEATGYLSAVGGLAGPPFFVTGGDRDDPPEGLLDVTGYVSAVAGFVEFPIVIAEGGRNTIVLHPGHDPNEARRRFGEDFEVQQLGLGYPWSDLIPPQDLAKARWMLREERCDLASDLGLQGYEGTLAFLVPKEEVVDFSERSAGSVELVMRGITNAAAEVRWMPPLEYGDGSGSRSARRRVHYAVYRDGILLSETPEPQWSGGGWPSRYTPMRPRIVANLPKSRSQRIDLARTRVSDSSQLWDSPVYEAYVSRFCVASLERLLEVDPADRLFLMANFIASHNVQPRSLWEIFPRDRWPVAFLEAGGRIKVNEWQTVARDPIFLAPAAMDGELKSLFVSEWHLGGGYDGILMQWVGDPCVANITGPTGNLRARLDLSMTPIDQLRRRGAIRFLQPPWRDGPPLLQEIWLRPQGLDEVGPLDTLFERASGDPASMTHAEVERLRNEGVLGLPWMVDFPEPFERCFAYGWEAFNLKHPATRALLQLAARFALARRCRTVGAHVLGRVHDALKLVFLPGTQAEHLVKYLHGALALGQQAGLVDPSDSGYLPRGLEEFVPGTQQKRVGLEWIEFLGSLGRDASRREFGQALTRWPPR